jgi:hypothetical protein
MTRSAAIVPMLVAFCFLVVEEVDQAVIGWIAAAFLVVVPPGGKISQGTLLHGLLFTLGFLALVYQ